MKRPPEPVENLLRDLCTLHAEHGKLEVISEVNKACGLASVAPARLERIKRGIDDLTGQLFELIGDHWKD
jgi:hypothetical protein